jgi:hypothetical protein
MAMVTTLLVCSCNRPAAPARTTKTANTGNQKITFFVAGMEERLELL